MKKIEQRHVADGAHELLEELISELPPPAKLDGVVVGRLAGFDTAGRPLVSFEGTPEPVPARTTVTLERTANVAEIILVFESGDARRPIVTGVIQQPEESRSGAVSHGDAATATLDGDRVVLSADREIVLECGKASITLRRNGRVVIRGAYVETRSEGRNRIKGGSVEIN